MKKVLIFFCLFASCHLFAGLGVPDPDGYNIIVGEVIDVVSGEHLTGATALVNELKNIGGVSDSIGAFRIRVPYGAYSLKISMIGYQTIIKTDVIVNAGRETKILIKMQSTSLQTQTITVKGDYFDRSIQANNLSTVVLNAQEIRRSPGSIQDFQRILQSMPGVGFSSDQTNELLVRGGSPNENLVVFDDIEIQSVNHYPNEMNSGGPINMVNVDLVEDVQFSTGGFISKYGDKLSSIIVLNTREGRRATSLAGDANISMAGAGLILEGGYLNGSGSWLYSFRKSYLDLIVGAIGLTAIPKYYDSQFKVVYDLSTDHKLSWSGIYGNDYIKIEGEPDKEDIAYANRIDSVGVENVLSKSYSFATGLSLRSFWRKDIFSTTTVSFNKYHYDVDVTDDFTQRIFNDRGKMINSNILNQRRVFKQFQDNGELVAKFDLVWLLNPATELNAGGAVRTGYYDATVTLDADTARYDLNGDGFFEVSPVVVPAAVITSNVKVFEEFKQYYYANAKFKLFDERMIINAGLRYDRFSYSNASNVSPRFSMTYFLQPQITSVNFAYGHYYQSLAYPEYGDRYNSMVNKFLENSKAVHYVLGFEHIIDEGLKFNIEAYYKHYEHLPVSEEFIHFNDRTFRSERTVTIGQSYTYGVDILLQQKLVSDIYGTVSLSLMKSRRNDQRAGMTDKEFPSRYEFPKLFTLILGKRFSGLRDQLDDSPFYIKYPSYILPFSNDMEISFRWRYSSGQAYTKRLFTTNEQHREGGVNWSKGWWYYSDDIYGERFPAYHRLDIGFNSRYNFTNWNLVVSLAIQNVYNQKNIAGYSYNSDGTRETIYQYSLLPVLGLEAEF